MNVDSATSCSGRTPSGTASPARTAAARIPKSRSSGCASSSLQLGLARRRVPVPLEILDQLRAVVAVRLLAAIDRHVLAKQVDRLLAESHRFAIARGADHA